MDSIESVLLSSATIVAGPDGGEALALPDLTLTPVTIEFAGSALDGASACNFGQFLQLVNFRYGDLPSASNDTSCLFGNGFGFFDGGSLGLSPLIAAGGSRAHFPLAGSPLLDIDDAFVISCPPYDQIGNTRPVDGDGDGSPECDMGAIEVPEPNVLHGVIVGMFAIAVVVRRAGPQGLESVRD